MDAIIMAAGKGTRLFPLTASRPKPMVPFVNKPMLDYIIRSAKTLNPDRIVVLVDYLSDHIVSFLKQAYADDPTVEWVGENMPYGTAGAVKKALAGSDDDYCLVLSGDVISSVNLKELVAYHEKKQGDMTIALHPVTDTRQYGIATLDGNGRVERFLEKPTREESFSDLANAGMYVCDPHIFDTVPSNIEYDFSKQLIPKLLTEKRLVYGYAFEDYWNDVGKPETYLNATYEAIQNMPRRSIKNSNEESILVAGTGSIVSDDIAIKSFAVLGENVNIGQNSAIAGSVIWSHAKIGKNVEIHDAIIGENVIIGDNVTICNGAVIGDNVIIEDGSTIGANIKVWRDSKIGAKSIITQDLNPAHWNNL